MNNPFRVVIVGAGDMGKAHAKAWRARPDSLVVAIADPDAARATALASEYQAEAYIDYAEAIEKVRPDIVSICVPVNLHRVVAEAAFRQGSHVLVEKPIAGSLDDARAMQAAAEKAERKLVVSYQYRALPGYAKLHELLGNELPVDRLFFRCVDVREVRPKTAMHHKSMNGGPIVDMCGHFFDLARYLFGTEPLTVYAKGHIYGAGRPRLAAVHDPAIDAAEIVVGFEGGHTLSVYVNWGMPEGFPVFSKVELLGPSFHASVGPKELSVTTAKEALAFASKADHSGPAVRIEDLIQSIRNESEPELSAEAGIRALAVSLAAIESIETGAEIALADVLG